MFITRQEFEVLDYNRDSVIQIEQYARTCYKSEDTRHLTLIKRLIDSGHHSQLEHEKVTVKFVTDRGVTHELVRHRMASYSQESTRWCNYSQDRFGKQVTFVLPVWLYDRPRSDPEVVAWSNACTRSEEDYFHFLSIGWTPQKARAVLNNSLKTEIVVTANLREWRHIFALRCAPDAHPQMQELMKNCLKTFRFILPIIFDTLPVIHEQAIPPSWEV